MSNSFHIKPIKFWCQKVLPLVYDDSLSYYELLCKVVNYLNNIIKTQNLTIDKIQEMQNAIDELNYAIENFFKSDNVMQIISDIITEMKNNGDFNSVIGDAKPFDNLPDFYYVENLIDKSFSDIYALFDEFVNDGIITKSLLGYASSSVPSTQDSDNAESNPNYPIYLYSYKSPVAEVINKNINSTILLGACIHGNEKNGIPIMLTILNNIKGGNDRFINRIISKFNIDFIPCINPWGVNEAIGTTLDNVENYAGRKNARGVNLNRNGYFCWNSFASNEKGPVPGSEAETKILEELFIDTKYAYYIEYHGSLYNSLFYTATDDDYFKESCIKTLNAMNDHINSLGINVKDYYYNNGNYRKLTVNAANVPYPMNDFVHLRYSLHCGSILETARAMFNPLYPPLGFHTETLQRISCEFAITSMYNLTEYLDEFLMDYKQDKIRSANARDNLLPMNNLNWVNLGINSDGTLTPYQLSNRLTTFDRIPIKAKTTYTLGIKSLFGNQINIHYYNDDNEHSFYSYSSETRSFAFSKAGYIRPIIRGSDNTKFIQKQRIGETLIPFLKEDSFGLASKVFQVSSSAPEDTITINNVMCDILHNSIAYNILFSVAYTSQKFPVNTNVACIRLPFVSDYRVVTTITTQSGRKFIGTVIDNVFYLCSLEDGTDANITLNTNFNCPIKSFYLSTEAYDGGGSIYDPDE